MNAEERLVSTGGGAYLEGSMQTDGDFIGRDKITHEVHYHYVERPAAGIPYLAPNLPPHHVPREVELAELRQLFLSDERQVAVTALRGMGGVGKTTLAIALCHDKQIIEAFPDGILWATLGPQADLLSAQVAWGMALGADLIALPDAEARAARLRSLLHDRRCLLVIDDVWDANHLPSLQVGGSHCATLVTTRERKIAQKVGITRDLDVLEPAQAMALLEQWAGEIAEEEKAVAGELARRLGYLPLALALAGAQTQDGQTWEGLLAAFRDTQGGNITLLDLDDPQARDESLALAFGLSVDRLGEALPVQFTLLGVFAAGREAPFEVEATAAIWQVTLTQARKTLDRLVRAALLARMGERYALHLLLGDYARSRLDETTRQAAEARHRAYYLEVARQSGQDWRAAEVAWPQMRTAWSQLARDDADSLFAWAFATSSFFKKRGRWADKALWDEVALAAIVAHGQRQREAWCRRDLAEAYFVGLDKLAEALEQCQLSLTITRELGNRLGEMSALNGIGRILSRYGQWTQSLEAHETALAIAREMGKRGSEAWELNNIGFAYVMQGELTKAFEYFQASLTIMREVNDRRGEAKVLNNIADIYEQHGELAEALVHYQGSLSLQEAVGDRIDEAASLLGIGDIHAQRGELAEALECYRASLIIAREVGHPSWQAKILNKLSQIYRRRGELAMALEQSQNSLAIRRRLGDKAKQAHMLWEIGLIYAEMNQAVKAEVVLAEALALYEVMNMSEAAQVRADLERVHSKVE
jgi:tetratricopeptide (TPR) repeat protein